MNKKFAFSFFLVVCAVLVAQAGDPVSQTQTVLTNRQEREKAIKQEGPAAVQNDNRIKEMAGSKENEDDFYKIAAEILPSLDSAAGGDPEKMQQALSKANSDPEGWYKSLPPETQKKIRDLASKLPAKKNP